MGSEDLSPSLGGNLHPDIELHQSFGHLWQMCVTGSLTLGCRTECLELRKLPQCGLVGTDMAKTNFEDPQMRGLVSGLVQC